MDISSIATWAVGLALFLGLFCCPFITWVEERRHFKQISFVSVHSDLQLLPLPATLTLYCKNSWTCISVRGVAVRVNECFTMAITFINKYSNLFFFNLLHTLENRCAQWWWCKHGSCSLLSRPYDSRFANTCCARTCAFGRTSRAAPLHDSFCGLFSTV